MEQRIFWVACRDLGRLAVVSRPRRPADFTTLKRAGIDVLVSLQEPEEAAALGLANQAELCAASGLTFYNLPITDHGLPASVEVIETLSRALRAHLAAGQGVAAHCFAGLGRSPLMVAAVLIDAGHAAIEACDLVSSARGQMVPEMATQAEWLLAYEMRLGRT